MDDGTRMVPIEDLHFKKQANQLPAELIDRITLIYYVFRDYLSVTLEKTIDNFKYDKDPEREIRIWEHMASVILALKYQHNWTDDKLKSAAKVLLGLSTGAIQDNDLDKESTEEIINSWNNREPR